MEVEYLLEENNHRNNGKFDDLTMIIFDRNLGGINLGTDSYFPPEAKVRLVRLVPSRDCVNLGTGECTRCISYAIFGQY